MSTAGGPGFSVLVVDDEDYVRASVEAALKLAGITNVATASEPMEAMEILASRDVGIVLLLELGPAKLLDGESEVVVDVLVIPELLNHLSGGEAQLCHQTLRSRGLRGRNHECSSLVSPGLTPAIVGCSCA